MAGNPTTTVSITASIPAFSGTDINMQLRVSSSPPLLVLNNWNLIYNSPAPKQLASKQPAPKQPVAK